LHAMSASLPCQAWARQGAWSRTSRATNALRHEARRMPEWARHEPKAGAALGERTARGGALAHGRRTEPVARRRRLETQPRCFSATCEHSTEQDSGEAGNERCENYPLALLGGSPLAEGRAACTNDSQQPRPRASLCRRTRCYAADTALACVCARSCQCASRLTLDMSGDWKRAKHAGRRPLDGRVRRLYH